MSVSCVGTCSNCGRKRFWLSDTLSLHMDDGKLICLPHPAESGACEAKGLTLAQASERGRLYWETFYVCRTCGKEGETIERKIHPAACDPFMVSIPRAMKWCWGTAVIVVPFLMWMRWWQSVAVIGATLFSAPGMFWWDNRKRLKEIAARGFPRSNAPGGVTIAEPAKGLSDEIIVGRLEKDEYGKMRATGACCNRPDWIEAWSAKEEDRVPCYACGQGVMEVSEFSIH
jgi:hypothetical protein